MEIISNNKYVIGSRVYHERYNEGKIVNIIQTRNDIRLSIQFEGNKKAVGLSLNKVGNSNILFKVIK